MEWLRCNKCYRAMKKSKRTFLLTQCGHLYCSQCMAGVNTKCLECGSQNFATMPLTFPPKLETSHNYFAYLDEFMEICLKTEEFQYNQLIVAVRGFEEIEKKYENMKRSYWHAMKQMKIMTQAYQKVEEETNQLEKIRDSLLNLRLSRFQRSQPVREHSPVPIEPQRRTRTFGSTRRYGYQGSTADFNADKPKLQTPPQAYIQNIQFPTGSSRSNAYASDSGISSRSVSSHAGVFLIPSGQKVPRSAAALKRKTPTFSRLTEPKTGFTY